MRSSSAVLIGVVAALLILSQAPTGVWSAACDPSALSPCLGAITASAPPTQGCCDQLKQQKGCFCQYLNSPSMKAYINSANGKRVAAACGVAYPKC